MVLAKKKLQFLLNRSRIATTAVLISLLSLSVAIASAQDSPVYGRTRALDESRSQAEQQAEQTVSLSADKLVSLLQKETGLLLEVKKLLVRKAFEQGRILEPKDLTDDALFRLLRVDEDIRVLATQELLKRGYIRALPTSEEGQRDVVRTKEGATSTPGTPAKPRATSQEEQYWDVHEQRKTLTPQLAQPPDDSSSPESAPRSQPHPEPDSRRTVQQAQMQDSDELDSMPMGGGSIGADSIGGADSMERIRPEDLPALIRARSEQRLSPGSGESGL